MILIPVITSNTGFSYYFTPIETSIPYVYHLVYINPVKPFKVNFYEMDLNSLKTLLTSWISEGFINIKVVKEFEYILEEHLNGSDT